MFCREALPQVADVRDPMARPSYNKNFIFARRVRFSVYVPVLNASIGQLRASRRLDK